MQVVAFNGSPRKQGNTLHALQAVMLPLQKAGIGTELVQLGGEPISGCKACYACAKAKDGHCHGGRDDMLNDCIDRMRQAQGILLGSPTYFSNVSSEIKALIDRAGLVAKVNADMFKRKVGAAVVVARRAGATHVFSSINYFFLINQMVVPGSRYWNLAIGREPGEIQKDEEGQATLTTLGENMAWLLKKLYE
ncbi:MAG: flavodoxin family protein [bacterium]